jgi:hypothetical protein
MLFKELHIPLTSPPLLWCDNLGAIALASNPSYHAITKHIEVDYHSIREKILHKDIVPRFICTLDQCVDIFTKDLTSSFCVISCSTRQTHDHCTSHEFEGGC